MEILTFDQLPQGGFAGLIERRFVTDRRVFRNAGSALAFDGLANFVYLADANFMPKGETTMHNHQEVDVISVMVEGRISHAGSLEHGQGLEADSAQVQRAGGEGFSHNEINPDDTMNQMVQLWVLPDEQGEAAGYKVYQPETGKLNKIYGGKKDQDQTFHSHTAIAVAPLEAGQSVEQSGEVLAYLSKGSGVINGETIKARTLVRADSISFSAAEESQLIVVYRD
jgi:redox-sensitive bicupin YhaK (pirin superfamily)